MVTDNGSLDEQLRCELAKITSELESAKTEIDRLVQRVSQLSESARGYHVVLEHRAEQSSGTGSVSASWVESLRPLKHKDQLIAIAERQKGRLLVSEAATIMYLSKLINTKKRKNAYNIVSGYATGLADEGIFEKVGPGEFRVVGFEGNSPYLNDL